MQAINIRFGNFKLIGPQWVIAQKTAFEFNINRWMRHMLGSSYESNQPQNFIISCSKPKRVRYNQDAHNGRRVMYSFRRFMYYTHRHPYAVQSSHLYPRKNTYIPKYVNFKKEHPKYFFKRRLLTVHQQRMEENHKDYMQFINTYVCGSLKQSRAYLLPTGIGNQFAQYQAHAKSTAPKEVATEQLRPVGIPEYPMTSDAVQQTSSANSSVQNASFDDLTNSSSSSTNTTVLFRQFTLPMEFSHSIATSSQVTTPNPGLVEDWLNKYLTSQLPAGEQNDVPQMASTSPTISREKVMLYNSSRSRDSIASHTSNYVLQQQRFVPRGISKSMPCLFSQLEDDAFCTYEPLPEQNDQYSQHIRESVERVSAAYEAGYNDEIHSESASVCWSMKTTSSERDFNNLCTSIPFDACESEHSATALVKRCMSLQDSQLFCSANSVLIEDAISDEANTANDNYSSCTGFTISVHSNTYCSTVSSVRSFQNSDIHDEVEVEKDAVFAVVQKLQDLANNNAQAADESRIEQLRAYLKQKSKIAANPCTNVNRRLSDSGNEIEAAANPLSTNSQNGIEKELASTLTELTMDSPSNDSQVFLQRDAEGFWQCEDTIIVKTLKEEFSTIDVDPYEISKAYNKFIRLNKTKDYDDFKDLKFKNFTAYAKYFEDDTAQRFTAFKAYEMAELEKNAEQKPSQADNMPDNTQATSIINANRLEANNPNMFKFDINMTNNVSTKLVSEADTDTATGPIDDSSVHTSTSDDYSYSMNSDADTTLFGDSTLVGDDSTLVGDTTSVVDAILNRDAESSDEWSDEQAETFNKKWVVNMPNFEYTPPNKFLNAYAGNQENTARINSTTENGYNLHDRKYNASLGYRDYEHNYKVGNDVHVGNYFSATNNNAEANSAHNTANNSLCNAQMPFASRNVLGANLTTCNAYQKDAIRSQDGKTGQSNSYNMHTPQNVYAAQQAFNGDFNLGSRHSPHIPIARQRNANENPASFTAAEPINAHANNPFSGNHTFKAANAPNFNIIPQNPNANQTVFNGDYNFAYPNDPNFNAHLPQNAVAGQYNNGGGPNSSNFNAYLPQNAVAGQYNNGGGPNSPYVNGRPPNAYESNPACTAGYNLGAPNALRVNFNAPQTASSAKLNFEAPNTPNASNTNKENAMKYAFAAQYDFSDPIIKNDRPQNSLEIKPPFLDQHTFGSTPANNNNHENTNVNQSPSQYAATINDKTTNSPWNTFALAGQCNFGAPNNKKFSNFPKSSSHTFARNSPNTSTFHDGNTTKTNKASFNSKYIKPNSEHF